MVHALEFTKWATWTKLQQTLLSANFTSTEQEKYFELSRCIMDVSGQLKVLVWFEGSRDWQAIYTAPKAQCGVYASCGPFTVCNDVPFPSCTCMKGYSLQSPQDWELGDRAGGCSRNTPFYCDGNASAAGTADKFDPMPSVQLPADAQNVGTATSLQVQTSAHLSALEAVPAPHIPTIKVAAPFGMISCSTYGNKVTVFFTFASLQKNCKVVKVVLI
jgi:hypothetical protein